MLSITSGQKCSFIHVDLLVCISKMHNAGIGRELRNKSIACRSCSLNFIDVIKGKPNIGIKLVLFGRIRYFMAPFTIPVHSEGLVNYIWRFENHYFSRSCKMTYSAIIETLQY